MNYYKVVSPRGGVVCITHIKGLAENVLKMFPSNYKIEVIKGDICLLYIFISSLKQYYSYQLYLV